MSLSEAELLWDEGSTPRYRGTLRDEDGVAIPGSDLYSLTVTITDKETGTVINGRSGVNCLNTNGGSVSELGVFTFQFVRDDMAVLDATLEDGQTEDHLVYFAWQFGDDGQGGRKCGGRELALQVVARQGVTV